MAASIQQWNLTLFFVTISFFMVMIMESTDAAFQMKPWSLSHATFYGDETGRKFYLIGGACGYGNFSGYGLATAIKCTNSKWCNPGTPYTTVTATNLCPPNWYQDSNNGGWCNPPRTHFDMAKPAFMKIAEWKAGIVPVMYRSSMCQERWSKFLISRKWILVTSICYECYVGGGDISQMWVKGTKTGWISMTHNWGASYQAFAVLGGQALSFKITSYSTKETIIAYNVAPPNWSTGMTYKCSVNFR
ncbi:hypothetical protein MKX01_031247 [Papaver californicum]|nr:hypothetical protein MKX01_031247 [Papaver californicum]